MSQIESSIVKKLFIKPGKRWLVYNIPPNYLSVLEPLPAGTGIDFTPVGHFDGVQLFVRNRAELADGLTLITPLLKDETIFWITYPKKSSGKGSDLEMMGDWEDVGNYGLRVVAAVSINETWTALRFKPARLTKITETRNDEIRKNEYADFIDVDNKQVTLPPDVKLVLEKSAVAMSFYQSLSYSNKKEYVIWILSAKQEKTRTDRLLKMIEKLSDQKKNPSEK